MSQAQLAGPGLSDSYISLIESGRRVPSRAVVELLAARLGCSVTYLRCGVEDSALNELTAGLAAARRALHAGRPDQALEQLTLLTRRPDLPQVARLHVEVQCSTAVALEALHRFDEAIDVWRRLLDAADAGGCDGDGSSGATGGTGDTGEAEPAGMGWAEWARLQVALARCQRRGGHDAAAARSAESAFTHAVSAADAGDVEAAEAAVHIGVVLVEVLADAGEVLLARQISARLPAMAEDCGHPHARLLAYQQAVLVAEITGDTQEAARWAERALRLLEADEQVRSAAELRTRCAAVLLRVRPTQAEHARVLLTGQLVELAITGATAETLAHLAEAELLLGRVEQAAAHARQAIDTAGADGPEGASVTDQARARALAVLAGACERLGDQEEAIGALVSRAEILGRHGPCRQAALAWVQAAELSGRLPMSSGRSGQSGAERLHFYQRAVAAMGLGPQIINPA